MDFRACGAFPTSSFVLSNSIDAGGTSDWYADSESVEFGLVPLSGSGATGYSGTFDGNGFTISNLVVERENAGDGVGLFGSIEADGVVRNLRLENASVVSSEGAVGAVAGVTRGTMENVLVSDSNVEVIAASECCFQFQVGGLYGVNDNGTVNLSAFENGAVSAFGDQNVSMGGLGGSNINGGTTTDSYAIAELIADVSGDLVSGGLVGAIIDSEITRAFAATNSVSDGAAGGLVGVSLGDSLIISSFWDATTSGLEQANLGTPITSEEFQSTEFFFEDGGFKSAEWDERTTWAPGGNGEYPALYALSPVVYAEVGNVRGVYGSLEELIDDGFLLSVFGGPGSFVFAPSEDEIDTDSLLFVQGFPDLDANPDGYPIETVETVTSAGGVPYRVVGREATLVVEQAPAIVVTANDQEKPFGQPSLFASSEAGSRPANRGEVTVTGLADGDMLTTVALLAEPGAGKDDPIGEYPLVPSKAVIDGFVGKFGDNYTGIIYVPGIFRVVGVESSEMELRVVVEALTKTYGQDLSLDDFVVLTDGLAPGDTLEAFDLSSGGIPAAADVDNYNIVFEEGSIVVRDGDEDVTGSYLIELVDSRSDGDIALIVNPAPLTITPFDASKTVGTALTFPPNAVEADGLVLGQAIESVELSSEGAPASATVEGSPYAIVAQGPVVIPFEARNAASNYDISFGSALLTVAPDEMAELDPRPDQLPVTDVPGLPKPADIILDFDEPTGAIVPAAVTSDTDVSQAEEAIGFVGTVSGTLQFASESCRQETSGTVGYLSCLVSALDEYATALDALAVDLPPELKSVSGIIVDLRNNIETARSSAEIRLRAAGSDAERSAIQQDAIEETRAALQAAAAEIEQAISLIRSDDPELASIQIETGGVIVDALFTLDTELSRATEL